MGQASKILCWDFASIAILPALSSRINVLKKMSQQAISLSLSLLNFSIHCYLVLFTKKSTETVFVKVSNNSHVVKSCGPFFVPILFHVIAGFDRAGYLWVLAIFSFPTFWDAVLTQFFTYFLFRISSSFFCFHKRCCQFPYP